MVDRQSVIERLEALQAYLTELDHHAQYSSSELITDFVRFRAAEHSLQLSAQVVMDIAAHIITADFSEQVQEYRQAIESLGKVGVLEPDFAARLAPLAGFRNILVHDYLAVDPERVYTILIQGRAELREFGRQIGEYLKKSDKTSSKD